MKKLIIAFLAAALVLTLTACGGKSIALPPVSIPVTDPNATTAQTEPTEPIPIPPNLHINGANTADRLR